MFKEEIKAKTRDRLIRGVKKKTKKTSWRHIQIRCKALGSTGLSGHSADLICCRLLSAGVLVSERPIEGGDVNTAASLAHEIEPGLEDGGVSGAGVKLQPLRDALHQNNPDRKEERKCLDNGDSYLYQTQKSSIGQAILQSRFCEKLMKVEQL